MKRLLESISGEINRDLSRYHEEERAAFVGPDCTINMRAFAGRTGFDKESLGRDEASVLERQIDFAGARSERVREFYRQEHGAETMDDLIRAWKANREKSASSKLEMAVTGVFHKVLKSEFLVVRSSTYDDYHNGADTIIVNKETGDVICAIDEFHDQGDRTAAKADKARKTDGRGTGIKYGLTFEKDAAGASKLAAGPIRNIPIFYLKLSREELESLLAGMDCGSTDQLAPVELETFDKLTGYLEKQAGELESRILNPALAENLKRATKSIKRMAEIRQEKFG